MTIAPPELHLGTVKPSTTGSYQARQCDRFFVVGERYALG